MSNDCTWTWYYIFVNSLWFWEIKLGPNRRNLFSSFEPNLQLRLRTTVWGVLASGLDHGLIIFLNVSSLTSFSIFFKQTIQFLQQINVKMCIQYPVLGFNPQPLEHESSPKTIRPGLQSIVYNLLPSPVKIMH